MSFKTIIEPFKIKTVEPITMSTAQERREYLEKANYNPFLLDSSQVIIDFLTDSGTSAMSARQWAGLTDGDEAYAGSRSWHRMRDAIRDLTGFEYILPTHQGRAAERILYGTIGGPGKVFISNTHFDTTRANIEFSGAQAIDIPIPEALQPSLIHPFKGNMDVQRLRQVITEKGADTIGAVILTVTNNSGGGQPVSMTNAREIASVCHEHGVLFVLDACRVAENAWFIKHREEGFEEKSYREIASEMFSLADGAIMSAKKDALVNMGGFLALRDAEMARACENLLIITEGFTTYGGLSGRDMEAIAIGLEEVFRPDYLRYRIRSTAYLGENIAALGIPIIQPVGGHAVYIDAKALYSHISINEYPGQALVCELYRAGGIRAVEIGSVMFGKKDASGGLIPASMELVRLAIPRRVYTQSHIEYVIEVFEKLYAERESARGYRITWEPPFLRHFTAKFEPIEK
jgi:tryptophanase